MNVRMINLEKGDPGDKMGFPPNVALNMVANIFKKY